MLQDGGGVSKSQSETKGCRTYCSDCSSAPLILSHLQQTLPRELLPRPEQDAPAEIRTYHVGKTSRGGQDRGKPAAGGRGSESANGRERARARLGGGACRRRACAGGEARRRGGPWAQARTVAGRARGDGRWPTRFGMEHLERCAWLLRGTLVRAAVRRYLPWALVASMLAGSLLKELSPLPESYLSNKRNALNV